MILSDLRGKRVLVTGASGGIGSSTARLFGSLGASVGVHYHRDAASAKRLVRAIERLGGQAAALRADLADPKACDTLVRDFKRRFGGIDVLVNNAGVVAGHVDFRKLSAQDWDKTFAVNARAPFLLTRAAFAVMKSGGRVVNVTSVSAKYGGSLKTMHYGASKAALEALTVGLARQGAAKGILVNAVRAGFIDTDVHKALGRTGLKARVARIPLKRAGKPADVAQMIAFLSSDAASFVTGQVLSVSGGD